MKLSFINTNKLKEYILSSISQEEVFAFYLKCGVDDIKESITNPSKKILNILRNEASPSISFKYRSSKLNCKDWANNLYSGDCFHLAAVSLGKNINNKNDFTTVLWHIINNVIQKNVTTISEEGYIVLDTREYDYSITEYNPIPLEFDIDVREFTRQDLNVFYQWGIRRDTLQQNKVFAVHEAFLDDKFIYKYKPNDLCFAYYLGKDPISDINLYELYYPNREHSAKFRTNNIYTIKYPQEITKGLAIIVTKSRKDCLLLRQIVKDLGYTNIHFTQIHSETTIISDTFNEVIDNNYSLKFTLFDFDKAGRKGAYDHKRLYDYEPLHLTNGKFTTFDYFHGKEGKDITDYTKLFGIKATVKVVKDTIELYKHLIND